MSRMTILPFAAVLLLSSFGVCAANAPGQVAESKQASPNALPLPSFLEGNGSLTPALRAQAARSFVARWGGYFEKVYNQPVERWAVKQGQVIGRADPANIRSAMTKSTLEAAMMALRGHDMSDDKAIDYIATREQKGLAGPMALGDLASDLVFVPLPPCRIFDTRSSGGALASGGTRNFDTYPFGGGNFSYQGGTASGNCDMVPDAAAVVINIAAPLSTVGGFLTVYPYGTTRPLASNLDYSAGELKNNEIVAKSANGAWDITVYAHGATHVVGDVVGYFIRPQATALNCVDTADTNVTVAANATANAVAPACAAGYTQTATNCESSTWQMPFVFFSGGTCSAQNNSSSSAVLRASRTCCRVPGR